jgi:ABC-2 type transport system permease protein
MSSVRATQLTLRSGPPAHSTGANTPPGLGRLTAVELRKMSDTVAGISLQLAVLAVTLIVVIATCATGHANHHTFRHILNNSLQPTAIMLPVIGVLLVTSEWSQRTTLTTFALVPQRSRVFAAKMIAAVAMSLPALVFCVVVSVIGTALASSGVPGGWTIQAEIFPQAFLYVATGMLGGVAFGAAFLNSVSAVASYFGLPFAISALTALLGKHSFISWIDGSTTLVPMTQHRLSGTEWGRAGTTLAVWMALPLAIGLWRVMRSEIK